MAVSQAKNASLPLMNLVRTSAFPILHQLRLEERLLRTSTENWCIINEGTMESSIVMGVSGKLNELVETRFVLRDGVPVIRRFTGGGTVVVGKDTIFVTFICNKNAVPGVQPYPKPIMSWTSKLYSKSLSGLVDFSLRENDYVIGDRKFGGNAQSITKARWLHHTSFLWNYDPRDMKYLKHPPRAPSYRSMRTHSEFLCTMNGFLSSSSEFTERTVASVGDYFSLRQVDLSAVAEPAASEAEFFHSTRLLTEDELKASLALEREGSEPSISVVCA
ncbi:biotin/lipoate A/B protein ligase family [Wolffia australiana]